MSGNTPFWKRLFGGTPRASKGAAPVGTFPNVFNGYGFSEPKPIAASGFDALSSFPFETMVVSGEVAIEAASWLAKHRPGIHPIVMGDGHAAGTLADALTFDTRSAEEIETAALALDGDGLRARIAADAAALAERMRSAGHGEIEDPGPEVYRGDWPAGAAPMSGFSSIWSHRDSAPYEAVALGLVPVPAAESWRVFSHTKMGKWNACPPAEIHAAYARRWSETYSARLVSHTHDVLEYAIARPIETRADALKMALVHFDYCEDIVTQGVGTIDALAAGLIGATSWYFWWD